MYNVITYLVNERRQKEAAISASIGGGVSVLACSNIKLYTFCQRALPNSENTINVLMFVSPVFTPISTYFLVISWQLVHLAGLPG
jgi:hypothetical protein